MSDKPVVVGLSDVSKQFILRKDKSFKDRFLQPRESRANIQDFWALKDISLDIRAGSTIGLIGPNGSGKSTLLKVIGGIIESNSGQVLTRGRLAALLELGAGFHPDLTGRENVFLNASILGMSKEETEAKFDEIVAFSGIEQFIDTQVKFYSSGMYVRLAFSVAINVDPDILLVDEVLAVGDEAFQNKCLDKIESFQKEGRTIIIVSHSMGQITSLCDRAVVLRKGNIIFDGDPETAVDVMREGFAVSVHEGNINVGKVENSQGVKIGTVVSEPVQGDVLKPDSDLEVTVELDVAEETNQWDFSIALVNALGATVLASSAHAIGLGGTPISGKNFLKFRLPSLSIGEGGYSITAIYFDDRQREVVRREGVGPFKVVAGHESIGTVYSKVNGEIEKISTE